MTPTVETIEPATTPSEPSEPSNEAARRVLVVEDESAISSLIALHLRDAGFEVETVDDGARGFAAAMSGRFDLLILDLLLPVMGGLELCRRLRSESLQVPILMVTSRTTESDRIVGLETGADDYLTKPFSVRELVARVRAMFRRLDAFRSSATQAEGALSLTVGDIFIDPRAREVAIRGESVQLTAKEFDLLWFFCQHPGRAFRRLELLEEVWGYAYHGYDHTVNTHINRLRTKIEIDTNSPEIILTVWGVGYKLALVE